MVSVIIPVYNAERWLRSTIESIKNQTYSDLEIIFINDGSTDASADILTEAMSGDPRIQVHSIANSGVSNARNYGIEHSVGDWILFVDADDMLHLQAIQQLLNCATENSCEIVVGGVNYSECPTFRDLTVCKPRFFSPSEAIKTSLYQRPPLNCICGVLYKRKIFCPDGPRFIPNTRYEDLEIHHRLFAKADKIAYLPGKLYFYRKHSESFINTFKADRLDALTISNGIYEYYRGSEPERAAFDRRFSAHFNILLLLLANNSKDRESISRCLKVVRSSRMRIIADKNSRIKNRVGAALSMLGLPILRLISKHYFK